ncbi:hypothetical protein DU000_10970 [Parvibium lacunae]|uniref:Uncharacterized protein n=1 Tax=Parvibium lacunae TaxID=1888893 RepID=A0A368KZX8_9BURK|nr:hypothetical protein DU000_10970 [Parvibium lacunae]
MLTHSAFLFLGQGHSTFDLAQTTISMESHEFDLNQGLAKPYNARVFAVNWRCLVAKKGKSFGTYRFSVLLGIT